MHVCLDSFALTSCFFDAEVKFHFDLEELQWRLKQRDPPRILAYSHKTCGSKLSSLELDA